MGVGAIIVGGLSLASSLYAAHEQKEMAKDQIKAMQGMYDKMANRKQHLKLANSVKPKTYDYKADVELGGGGEGESTVARGRSRQLMPSARTRTIGNIGVNI